MKTIHLNNKFPQDWPESLQQFILSMTDCTVQGVNIAFNAHEIDAEISTLYNFNNHIMEYKVEFKDDNAYTEFVLKYG